MLPFLDAGAPPCRYSAGVSGWVLTAELEFHDTLPVPAVLRIVVYDVRDGLLDTDGYCFAAVIPTEQYDLTNDVFATVAATNAGMPNPACLQHLGVRLVRPKAGDETASDEDGADAPVPYGAPAL